MSIASHNESALPIRSAIMPPVPGEYFALLKPRVMSLVIWTALAGLLVAPTHVHPVIASPRCWRSRSGRARRARSICGGTPTLTLLWRAPGCGRFPPD